MEKEEIFKLLRGSFVLECGVGTGKNLLAYKKNNSFVGCDMSKEMISVCKHKLKTRNLDAYLVLTDAHDLPITNDVFDSVICSRAFKFFSDPDQSLTDIKRCLRKGGKCIVSLAVRDSILFKLAVRLRLINLYDQNTGTEERYYSKYEIVHLFEKNGFLRIRIIPVGNLFFGFYSFLWFNLYRTPLTRVFRCIPTRFMRPLLKIGRESSHSYVIITGEK
jgi:SAM-dependent methyltransferase